VNNLSSWYCSEYYSRNT